MWTRNNLITILITILITGLSLTGCSKKEAGSSDAPAITQTGLEVTFEAPAPMEVTARMEPESDSDWHAISNNKNIEIVEVLNIITPVAVYITAAFEQYSAKLGEITHEEWEDTQHQLTKGSTLYGDCVKRLEAGKYDRQLFLDLEESWQIFVKVGVAGLRTKAMLEADLKRAN
jgi:hypothetical protein